VMFMPFQLSMLVKEFKLKAHYQFMRNCIDLLLDENKNFGIDDVNGIQSVVYKNKNNYLIHLVNGIGSRPLASMIPYHNLNFWLKISKDVNIESVKTAISIHEVSYEVIDEKIHCSLERLDVWEMIVITTSSK
jgi:hypothetical protein